LYLPALTSRQAASGGQSNGLNAPLAPFLL